MTRRRIPVLFAGALLAMTCAPRLAQGQDLNSPPADLRVAAAAMYEAYGSAIATPRRGALAGFYHYNGAIRVLNGITRRLTRAAIDANYKNSWSPPTFFAWDGLVFDSVAPGEVIVTGGFRWQGVGQRDTVPYVYAALLVAVDSGLAIVFEHETVRPPN